MLDGAVRGVEEGWFQGEIADAAYELERKLNAGRHVVVGVNDFLEGNDEPPPPTLRIGPEVEEEQRRRLDKVRHERDADAVERALARVRSRRRRPDDVNLMPALLDAVARATRRSARSSTRWPTCSAAGSRSRGSEPCATSRAERPRPHRAAARRSSARSTASIEKSPGVFYRSRRAFLHFHEDGDDIYADVRLDGRRRSSGCA